MSIYNDNPVYTPIDSYELFRHSASEEEMRNAPVALDERLRGCGWAAVAVLVTAAIILAVFWDAVGRAVNLGGPPPTLLMVFGPIAQGVAGFILAIRGLLMVVDLIAGIVLAGLLLLPAVKPALHPVALYTAVLALPNAVLLVVIPAMVLLAILLWIALFVVSLVVFGTFAAAMSDS